MLLLQARESLMAHFRPLLTFHELTEQQWRIIRTLGENEPLEPHQLGMLCAISSPSISGVLRRMESGGLISRSSVPRDQRRVLVSLTEAGEGKRKTVALDIERRYAALENRIGTARLQQVYREVDKLLRTLASEPS
nr:homoprotocatechuate degradation operon regulator HpaR [Paraburkholderia caribensis]